MKGGSQSLALARQGGVLVTLIGAAVVTSRAEQYRQLASDCRTAAKTLSLGDRKALLEMADEWERFAD